MKKNNLKTISKFNIETETPKIFRWKNIIINGVETDYIVSEEGSVKNFKTRKILKPYKDDRGYSYYALYINSKRCKISLHRLLACIFIPIPDDLLLEGYKSINLVPNHIDGNKENTVVDNLEWMTCKDNTIHAFKNGLADVSLGENSHLSKVTKKDVIKICELLQKGYKVKYISEKTSISKSIILHIKNRETWKCISDKYIFPKNEKCKPYKYDDNLIHDICKLLEMNKFTDKEISKKLGVSREYVRDIRNKKHRRKISSQYNI